MIQKLSNIWNCKDNEVECARRRDFAKVVEHEVDVLREELDGGKVATAEGFGNQRWRCFHSAESVHRPSKIAGVIPVRRGSFFSILGEKSQAAASGGTSPTISVQRARKIEVQLRCSSELQDTEKTLVRHYTKDVRYSVKSGYHIEQTSKGKAEECSDPAPIEMFWKKLWATNVANRVKILAWKTPHICVAAVRVATVIVLLETDLDVVLFERDLEDLHNLEYCVADFYYLLVSFSYSS
ncbi:hypothetical protein U1Q18_008261 [Sarracenia purpurea var. burkii]